MLMKILSDKNRIVLYNSEGSQSILNLVKEVTSEEKYSWVDTEHRGPTSLLKRRGDHESKAFVLHQQLESVFRHVYSRYLNLYGESDFSPKVNFILTRIDEFENFMRHQDLNYDLELGVKGYVAVLYLNDDFDGGELYFNDLDISYKPVAGNVIVFPQHLWHEIKTVVGGSRYTAMLSVEKYSDISLASTSDLWPPKACGI